MGGGGGGGGRSLGDIRALEEQAKQVLQERDGERRSVFISFAFEDIDEVNLLRGQAKNDKSDLDFVDRSIKEPFDSDKADYIRQKIRERINQCTVTVVFLSAHAAESNWVKWEIEKSLELGKRVVGVFVGQKRPATLPDVVRTNKIKVVAWSDLQKELDKA